jgi:hypothetical protein
MMHTVSARAALLLPALAFPIVQEAKIGIVGAKQPPVMAILTTAESCRAYPTA